ncbi:MAG: NAD(P)/FAD-dependent oxidoreductase, partial [Alphaproteobacteria bacterium]|nr:NAD(P)/FAD-dependent oxidoreductase [Alphaproteobacteria bacterium]
SISHYKTDEQDWIYSNCSYVCSLFRSEIWRDLELTKFGLQVIPYESGGTIVGEGRDYFSTYADHWAQRREIARHSLKDVDAYERIGQFLTRQARFIKDLLLRTPPDPVRLGISDVSELIYLARKYGDLGAREMAEMIRFFTISAGDYVREYFETKAIQSLYAGSGIIGSGLSIFSPGTAYVLLHHFMGDVDGVYAAWGYARGGMGAITQALAKSFESVGGTIVSGNGIKEFMVRGNRVRGVVCDNGDVYQAKTVVSGMDARQTFINHMNESHLPADFVKQVSRFKFRGSSGKLNVALDAMPNFVCIPDDAACLGGDLHMEEDIEVYERSYDDWRRGEWSRRPYVDMLFGSVIDPTMAPPGKHVVSFFVQYLPYQLGDGRPWDETTKKQFADTVINSAARYCDIKEKILHMEIRTPADIEREVGLTEGNIFQGELSLDQLLFNRPVPGYAQYRSPIKGLYICGSSTHPGGGVMGANGANAAREILKDLKKPRQGIALNSQ